MSKLLKIENLLIIIYFLILISAFFVFYVFKLSASSAESVIVGLLLMLPFIIYFGSAHYVAPKLSRLFLTIHLFLLVSLFIPLKFIYFLPIPLFFIFSYLVKLKYRVGVDNWIKNNGFKKCEKLPTNILDKLGTDKKWQCFGNQFTLKNGKEIPYLIWFGKQYESMRTIINGVIQPTTYESSYLAISFSLLNINKNLQKIIERNIIENIMCQIDGESLYLSQKFSDNSVVFAWMCEPFPEKINKKLKDVTNAINQNL